MLIIEQDCPNCILHSSIVDSFVNGNEFDRKYFEVLKYQFDVTNVSSLGISVRDCKFSDGTVGVFIYAFERTGLAFVDGRLFTNDRLVSINSFSVADL